MLKWAIIDIIIALKTNQNRTLISNLTIKILNKNSKF